MTLNRSGSRNRIDLWHIRRFRIQNSLLVRTSEVLSTLLAIYWWNWCTGQTQRKCSKGHGASNRVAAFGLLRRSQYSGLRRTRQGVCVRGNRQDRSCRSGIENREKTREVSKKVTIQESWNLTMNLITFREKKSRVNIFNLLFGSILILICRSVLLKPSDYF